MFRKPCISPFLSCFTCLWLDVGREFSALSSHIRLICFELVLQLTSRPSSCRCQPLAKRFSTRTVSLVFTRESSHRCCLLSPILVSSSAPTRWPETSPHSSTRNTTEKCGEWRPYVDLLPEPSPRVSPSHWIRLENACRWCTIPAHGQCSCRTGNVMASLASTVDLASVLSKQRQQVHCRFLSMSMPLILHSACPRPSEHWVGPLENARSSEHRNHVFITRMNERIQLIRNSSIGGPWLNCLAVEKIIILVILFILAERTVGFIFQCVIFAVV